MEHDPFHSEENGDIEAGGDFEERRTLMAGGRSDLEKIKDKPIGEGKSITWLEAWAIPGVARVAVIFMVVKTIDYGLLF